MKLKRFSAFICLAALLSMLLTACGSEVLDGPGSVTMDDYVDYDTLTYSFDSEDFIEFLKVAGKFGNYDQNTSDSMVLTSEYGYFERLRVGQNTLQELYMEYINKLYKWETKYVGEDLTVVGYPSATGSGSAMSFFNELGISALSGNVEGAWAFIKTILSKEYQSELTVGIPVIKSVLEETISKYMQPLSEEDAEDPNLAGDYTPMSQAHADKLWNLINSINHKVTHDETLLGIIKENTAAFFAGAKSAEDTARVIQSRAQIYLSEQG